VTRRIVEFAPAKVNLCLHVTGRRDDGYHFLDSLVVFAGIGDQLGLSPADEFSLTLSGPMAAGLEADQNNLVLNAAHQLHILRGKAFRGARFELEKNLPVASGIGGGSADAAAALRAGQKILKQHRLSDDELVKTALLLGADVPVCLASTSVRMSGIGEKLTPISPLPECHIVLANPRVEVSTGKIFSMLEGKYSANLEPMPDQPFGTSADLCTWLARNRNDLEVPAIACAPQIGEVLEALEHTHEILLARMSGSGATCFGLYETADTAQRAAETLRANAPEWWIVATHILPTLDH